MSRSFKHTAGWCDRNPFSKKTANKRVRKTEELSNGNSYKKVFCSYNICDHKFLFFSKKEVKNWQKTFNIPEYKTRIK